MLRDWPRASPDPESPVELPNLQQSGSLSICPVWRKAIAFANDIRLEIDGC
jgi:hypothetical protein